MLSFQYDVNEISDCFTKTAANIISYYEGDERKTKLEELRKSVKNNCTQIQKLNDAKDLKARLLQLYKENDPNNDTVDIMKEYKKGISSLKKDASRSERLLEFERQVEALLHGKEGSEHGDNDDEDMQLTGGYVNVIDPVSKKRIVDPVKNSICGHTYDRNTITELLKINKNTRCPVVGCRSKEYVSIPNLKQDIVTQMYLDQNPE